MNAVIKYGRLVCIAVLVGVIVLVLTAKRKSSTAPSDNDAARLSGDTIEVPPQKITPGGNPTGDPPPEQPNEVVSSNFLARIEALEKSEKADKRTVELYRKAREAFTNQKFEDAKAPLKEILMKIDRYDGKAYELLLQMEAKRVAQMKAGH